ncbi:MAG: hypothetical protein ABIX28_04855 [Vicinamibacterales bacterium]
MTHSITRRDAFGLIAAIGALGPAGVSAQAQPPAPLTPVQRNDASVAALLTSQIVDSSSRWRGSVPDAVGLYSAGSAGSVAEAMAAAFVHPESRFHRDPALLERIRLAAGFLERSQSPQGNVDLLTTNFNSPPDTGFVVHLVATAANLGRRHGAPAITQALQPFLVKAGGGMAAGGVHTPNHRWVISSALAQINELFPDPRLIRRVDEWLAEGIDIDADGQFTERSTLTYNVVTDRALLVMAIKLRRPALFEPVRRNLHALAFLLHADGEVVTEISRRQDQYMRGGVGGYWFPLTWLAIADGDRRLAAMARMAGDGVRLSTLLEYPELSQPLPAADALPEDFEHPFPELGIVRIRRGRTSATLIQGGSSRLLTLRHGAAIVDGVRFASAFFGKGQFIPDAAGRREGTYWLRQALEAPYYQPLGRTITAETWTSTRADRRQSEIGRLEQRAEVTEVRGGFRLRLRAEGTPGVPLAVEIGLRPGGELTGCTPVAGVANAYLLESGTATYRTGSDVIRFGPGAAPHRYVQVRGAEPALPGQSVYLTGYTPFDHTLTFEVA